MTKHPQGAGCVQLLRARTSMVKYLARGSTLVSGGAGPRVLPLSKCFADPTMLPLSRGTSLTIVSGGEKTLRRGEMPGPGLHARRTPCWPSLW